MARILLAGGGSGGHVTPLRAIAAELGQEHEIVIMTDRRFVEQTRYLFQDQPQRTIRTIFSGKYRRYANKSFLWHITHAPTVLKNLRDITLILLGTVQSINYFLWHRPKVVFCKGGYVCVPIGIAAQLFKVPIIIHDSDTHPGLTNRLLSRWALKIATGMPSKYYQYDTQKMIYSGIPVAAAFLPVTSAQQRKAKLSTGFQPDKPLLLVTGGGTGAKELNNLIVRIAPTLLREGWQIAQVTGKQKDASVRAARETIEEALAKHWHIYDFTELLALVQAADVVVSRAGATAMQEYANAQKPVILVPSPYLTGGHQIKNAELFAEHDAAMVLDERLLVKDSHPLAAAISELGIDSKKRSAFAHRLHKNFAKPQATKELAQIILDVLK
jgi:UDP-N-acetylglucosamine--N-acetylmuramyl-(pentapeptide) pyrophosphoryl-undecaprenol N-acetylglucosamine transferase